VSSLPESLTRFRSDLEEGINRERARRRGRRRNAVAGVALATAAAAVAVGLSGLFPGGGPGIVERAAAALEPRGDRILHIKTAHRWVQRDGTVQWAVTESWTQSRRPYGTRSITVGGDGRRVTRREQASSGFSEGTSTVSLYDPLTNTIYVIPPRGPGSLRSAPAHCAARGVATPRQLRTCAYPFFAPGPRTDLYRVTSLTRLSDARPFRYRVESRIVTRREALRINDTLAVRGPSTEYHRDRILELLQQENVTVSGRVRTAGRDAIRLVWNSGRSVYLVDADTYEPIRLREENQRGTRTTRFLTYETLPLNQKTRALLSLPEQHPTARVTKDRREYNAAALRLTFRG
jgi:hypothetical protein